ncbi:MAG: hypothetical protein IT324_01385 [Anaerolineae bacterium]|nr:hypothetical protein [Anaerolineae bacterium]
MTSIKDDTKYKRYFPVAVEIDSEMVWVTLADGRIIGNPLLWHPFAHD